MHVSPISSSANHHFLSLFRGFFPNIITSLLPFLGFNRNRHRLLYAVTTSSMFWRSRADSASSTMSSAYISSLTLRPPISTPFPFSLISLARPLMKSEKSMGDMTHPCLTPVLKSNHSVCSSPTNTALCTTPYIPFTTLHIFPLIPSSHNLFHRPFLHTVSYAFF